MALSQISLEFYCQFDSCLNLQSKIISSQNLSLGQDLMMLVGKLTKMIALQDYKPKKVSIPLRARKGFSIEEKASDLQIKIGRITPRLVNVNFIQIWKKVVLKVKEVKKIAYGILLFYSEVDSEAKELIAEEPSRAMEEFCKNPGHVVQVLRKTLVFLNGEMISLKVVREVNEILEKISPELVSCFDKTMTAFVLWDLIRCAVEYYREYGFYHYRIDIFDETLVIDEIVTNAKDIFKHSIKAVPMSVIGQIGSVYKRNPKIEFKGFTCPVIQEVSSKRYQDSSFSKPCVMKKELSKENEGIKSLEYLTEETMDCRKFEVVLENFFQEFIEEKLKSIKPEANLANFKLELISEFSSLIEAAESQSIQSLFQPENIIQEISKVVSM